MQEFCAAPRRWTLSRHAHQNPGSAHRPRRARSPGFGVGQLCTCRRQGRVAVIGCGDRRTVGRPARRRERLVVRCPADRRLDASDPTAISRGGRHNLGGCRIAAGGDCERRVGRRRVVCRAAGRHAVRDRRGAWDDRRSASSGQRAQPIGATDRRHRAELRRLAGVLKRSRVAIRAVRWRRRRLRRPAR